MAPSRTTNTQSEALQGLVQEIANIKMMPDADLPFLIGLETEVISYLRKPLEDMMGQMPGAGGAPPAAPDAGMPGMPPGAMGPPGMGGGAGLALMGGMGSAPTGPTSGVGAGPARGGGMMAPNAPNPDEVRRMANRRPM